MLVGFSFSAIIEAEDESDTGNENISKNIDIKKDKAIEVKMFLVWWIWWWWWWR